MESENNRGKFYGYRGASGALEGVALVGHTTLIESPSEDALAAFALIALQSDAPIHIIMSDEKTVENFWENYAVDNRSPRLTCSELLFELNFPYFELGCDWNVRLAEREELAPIAEAHAEVAFAESGIDPMMKDRNGFLARTLRRIEQKRTFVVFENNKLVFKADVVAETAEVIYLEGIYVAPEFRGQGIASSCLSKLSAELLCRAEHICLLSNVKFRSAHRSFLKAGFKNTGCSKTIFV
ncbi:MAG TPA: GNAT family N-acetyltransferase [Pyrinomonadaceae bacterium]|nr:GNAT family N-acetyltransferase [Pyrinomonadaceae bacterium]